MRHEPVPELYAPRRACVVSDGDGVRIVARERAPERAGRRPLQAGPLLVADGEVAFDPGADHEGFSAGAEQFDSDITQERHPRAALGLSDNALVAVACDGRRTGVDAGLSMLELADVMASSGRARRSTSTAAVRRRSSIAAISSTARTRIRTSRGHSRAGS